MKKRKTLKDRAADWLAAYIERGNRWTYADMYIAGYRAAQRDQRRKRK